MNTDSSLRYHPDHRGGDWSAPVHASQLYSLIGRERPLSDVGRLLREYVQGEQAPVVGALQLTCSDEAECEVQGAFAREVVESVLPPLQPGQRSAFRTANLGARYELGSARIAEDHFAKAQGDGDRKLMLLKLNSHVGADAMEGKPSYGWLSRFGGASTCCGALHALLAGDTRPFAQELAEAFGGDGVDRLAQIRDVDPEHQLLLAAIAQARLQAGRALLDVRDHTPKAPTVTMILPSVSFNRGQEGTEMLLGIYVCEQNGSETHVEYCGLGDQPGEYSVRLDGKAIQVEDPGMGTPRLA